MLNTRQSYKAKEGATVFGHPLARVFVSRRAKPRKSDDQQHYEIFLEFSDISPMIAAGHVSESYLLGLIVL